VSEHDALDEMIARAAREEQAAIDQRSGEHLLDVVNASKEQGSAALFELLNRAHKAALKGEPEVESYARGPDDA